MKGIFVSFSKFLRSSKKIMLVIVVTIAITLVISGTISMLLTRTSDLNIPSFANVRTLGVLAYWDSDCADKVEGVNWGTILVGSSNNVTFYVKSLTTAESVLYLNATEWVPAAISDYMTLSWNYGGTKIQPNEVIQVTLTLSASSSISFVRYVLTNDVNEFSFVIVIRASE